ncbi:hypothetical protein [Thermodesulfovibrio yellowstonii]|uniref:Uncharacterized protein n=1 Tax=Thermodesulfovibrio yellowstonii TaxID=28262 RepID=A0A9W6LJP3_9BACT|nr:hypothetical protein [Thermodesulfovibrio islandicus]GLI52892.1 hypothetical protein TISLANDTSLP1_05850 [Thermodesulfovibrio islandicus]
MIKYLVFFLIFFISLSSVYAENYFLPKTFLILPEESNVKIRWILPPEQRSSISVDKIHFVVDYKNEPLVVYENKLLFNPLKSYIVKLTQTVKDVICLDSGVLLFSDGINMGYLEMGKDSDVIPNVKLKVITKLPLADSKLFKGDNTVYAAGFNKKTKKYEVYLFNTQKSLFQKIVSFAEPVDALSGKEKHIFFSNGNVIKEYKEGKISIIYEHPRQKVEEIFYNKKTGLIYKTSNGAGIIKDKAALEFLQTENPLIFLKETSLYVFFSSVSGVLEIINIDDLRNFAFKVQKIVDIQQTF